MALYDKLVQTQIGNISVLDKLKRKFTAKLPERPKTELERVFPEFEREPPPREGGRIDVSKYFGDDRVREALEKPIRRGQVEEQFRETGEFQRYQPPFEQRPEGKLAPEQYFPDIQKQTYEIVGNLPWSVWGRMSFAEKKALDVSKQPTITDPFEVFKQTGELKGRVVPEPSREEYKKAIGELTPQITDVFSPLAQEYEELPLVEQIAYELPVWALLSLTSATGLRAGLATAIKAGGKKGIAAEMLSNTLAPVAGVEEAAGIIIKGTLKYGVQIPTETLVRQGLKISRLNKRGFENALDNMIDQWIGQTAKRAGWVSEQSRRPAKYQEWQYRLLQSVMRNRNWIAQRATENLVKFQAQAKAAGQTAEAANAQAVKATINDINTKLLPSGTFTGAQEFGTRQAMNPATWNAMTATEKANLLVNAKLPTNLATKPFVALTPEQIKAISQVAPVPPRGIPPVTPEVAKEVVYHGGKGGVQLTPDTPSVTGNPTSVWGVFFSPSKVEAQRLIDDFSGGKGEITSATLSLNNPYQMSFKEYDTFTKVDLARGEQGMKLQLEEHRKEALTFKDKLIKEGYDGIIIGEKGKSRHQEFVVFKKEQIEVTPPVTPKVPPTAPKAVEPPVKPPVSEEVETKALVKLGELKFGEPTPVKYLTSQTYYANILGVKPLVEPLELAKQNYDLVSRTMAQAIDDKIAEVNKAWGIGVGEKITARVKREPTKGVETLRNLLDKFEEAPKGLTTKQTELFNWFRNLNRTIIDGENKVRRALGMEEIAYREAYVRHLPDKMAEEILMGQRELPPSLDYWSKKLVGKKIFNPMEFHRQLSDDLAKLFTKDLGEAAKAMVFTGLKEINLAQPLKAFTEQMGAYSDVMPASTKQWVIDYVNQVIKGQQTAFDAELNRLVTDSGFGGLVNKVLKPFKLSLGRKPITTLSQLIGKGTIYSVLALPRPRLLRLMIRNMFQRTQELALHGVTPIVKGSLPDTPAIKALKKDSMFLKSYTGIEEWPTALLGKLGKIPLAPYQWTAVLNADRGMSIAYHDYLKLFQEAKYKNLRWASPKRTYKEAKEFLYPEERKLMLDEMEWSAGATQYQYIGMGMPEIFRHKTLAPVTRLQSWWMNHVFRFHREAMHRLLKGETTRGHKIPWSMRTNYLKYLALGGAILTSLGYTSSFLWNVLPHNISPAGQFTVGLWEYMTAKSDYQRNQAKRDIYNSWKAIVPGFLAYDEFEQFWSGEKPLWQLFFYGKEEEGPPPRIPTYGLEFATPLEKFNKITEEDLTEYNDIPANPDEIKAAIRDRTVLYDRSDYREVYPDIDAKLFITGQVTTIKTTQAYERVKKLIKEAKIDPAQISAVKSWQEAEERRTELGLVDKNITLTEELIMELLGVKAKPKVDVSEYFNE